MSLQIFSFRSCLQALFASRGTHWRRRRQRRTYLSAPSQAVYGDLVTLSPSLSSADGSSPVESVATTDDEAFAKVWSKFATLSMHNDNGDLLTYYRNPPTTTFNNTVESLLTKTDGDCNAWAGYLVNAMKTAGIRFDPAEANSLGVYRIVLKNSSDGDYWFFMNGFNILNAAGSNPYPNTKQEFPFINRFENRPTGFYARDPGINNTYTYVFSATPRDVVFSPNNLSVGQGNPLPQLHFTSHTIILYKGRVYDPSTGQSYTDKDEWTKKALFGFGKSFQAYKPDNVTGDGFRLIFKKPNADELNYNLFPYNNSLLK